MMTAQHARMNAKVKLIFMVFLLAFCARAGESYL